MAERRNVAVLCLAHFTKGLTARALFRILGSVAIIALARSVFVISTHPDDSTIRILALEKNSYVPRTAPLECKLTATPGELAIIHFTGNTANLEIDEIMALEIPERRREQLDAISFLRERLGDDGQ